MRTGMQFFKHSGYWLLAQSALMKVFPAALRRMATLVKEPLRYAQCTAVWRYFYSLPLDVRIGLRG